MTVFTKAKYSKTEKLIKLSNNTIWAGGKNPLENLEVHKVKLFLLTIKTSDKTFIG